MKKILLLITTFFLSAVLFGQEARKTQLELHSFKEVTSKQGLPNLGALFMEEGWPMDANGEEPCAWIRVKFENMPMADAESVSFDFGNSAPIVKTVNRLKEEENEVWLFVTPSSNAYMEARHGRYGTSNRLPSFRLEPKHVYDVVLTNDITVTIRIASSPRGATVRIEDLGVVQQTPATILGVPLGQHSIKIVSGDNTINETIEVTEAKTLFYYDLRPKKKISFRSEPSEAMIVLGRDSIIGLTPCYAELPYGTYAVRAENQGKSTVQSILVSPNSDDEVFFDLVNNKTFEVYATQRGKNVNAALYIDGEWIGSGEPSYEISKGVGKAYKVTMSYNGRSRARKIKVTEGMRSRYEFRIPYGSTGYTEWQNDYDAKPYGFSFGYVSKSFQTKGNGEKLKHDIFGEEGIMPGIQLGFHAQPSFRWGLGIYTGLFYEVYFRGGQVDYYYNIHTGNNGYLYYSSSTVHGSYREHDLYIPAHACYRIPFAEEVGLSVHLGFGFDFKLSSNFSGYESESENYGFGESGYSYDTMLSSKKFNLSAEFGFGLRLWPVQIELQVSRGLNNHAMFKDYGDFKTKQNKFTFSVAYNFGFDPL